MKITDLHLTCVGYPTEWLAVDDTGRSVFITYRYGELGVYPVDDDGFDGFGPVLWSLKIGGEHDGELYESWSGEALDGEIVPHDQAWRIGLKRERERQQAYLVEIVAKNGA